MRSLLGATYETVTPVSDEPLAVQELKNQPRSGILSATAPDGLCPGTRRCEEPLDRKY